MTYIPKPKVLNPGLERNKLGLTIRDYEGALSTLCAGCGHDSVTAAIIQACWGIDLQPHQLAKMSGIGCSSKTPAYFLNASHGFNSVHGRMPSVTTGANAANSDLIYLGISGDGDTASIGIGQFIHAIRRKLNMLYIVENNGVYGLTKGQFSATSELGAQSKSGGINPFENIDLCSLAVLLGASFVARGFSGDKKQLVPLIQAGLKHKGFALIDVISPCVTFNNHEESKKSYQYVRKHEEELNMPDLIMPRNEITTSYDEGSSIKLQLHDETWINLNKIEKDYAPNNRELAISRLQRANSEQKILTGLIYLDASSRDMHQELGTISKPLRDLSFEELCPGSKNLKSLGLSV